MNANCISVGSQDGYLPVIPTRHSDAIATGAIPTQQVKDGVYLAARLFGFADAEVNSYDQVATCNPFLLTLLYSVRP